MSGVSVPAQSTDAPGGILRAILWGIRVAVLVTLIDLFVGPRDQGGTLGQALRDYSSDLQSTPSTLWPAANAGTAQIGSIILVVCLVALSFLFPYLLVVRPLVYRRAPSSTSLPPTIAAVAATTTIVVAWTALLILLALVTGFNGTNTFAPSGALLGVLLLHALAFLYAGFLAAGGDADRALRLGSIAGLISGLIVGGAWLAYDFFLVDGTFAVTVGSARLVVLALLGFWAGRMGATLALREGAGKPKPVRPAHTVRRPAFKFDAGVFWIGVGLLLAALFFSSPTTSSPGSPSIGERLVSYALATLQSWVIIVAVVAALVALVVLVRWLWPPTARIRGLIWSGILYALALGGTGNRLRSRGYQRLLLAVPMVVIFFWPYLDPYVLGPQTDLRVSTLSDIGRYVMLALGLNVVVGFAGLLDLGYVAFFCFGAYFWAMLGAPKFQQIVAQFHNLSGFPQIPQQLPFGMGWGWLFWPALLFGALVAAYFGILLGRPTLRLRGDYLAIVTLGFGEIVPIVFKYTPRLTDGTNGVSGVPNPVVPGLPEHWTATTPFYYIMLGLIALAVICNLRLRDSRLGRAWVALREDEIATAASGVNTVRTKLMAFATGAFFSGLAGVFHASKLGIIAPDNFLFSDSIIFLAMVVLGGIGSIPGVILGAVIIAFLNLYALPQLNPQIASHPELPLYNVLHTIDFSNLRLFIFGTLLVAMMLLRPEGLIPSARRKAELHGEVITETEQPVMDALDAAIGGPSYVEQPVE